VEAGWFINPTNTTKTGRVSRTGHIQGYGEDWKERIEPGIPVVDTRTIPTDMLLKWSLQSPLINPDLKGVRGAKVEQDFDGVNKHPNFDMMAEGLHPMYKTMLTLGNLSSVSVEEYVKLAEEWGATVTYYAESPA